MLLECTAGVLFAGECAPTYSELQHERVRKLFSAAVTAASASVHVFHMSFVFILSMSHVLVFVCVMRSP